MESMPQWLHNPQEGRMVSERDLSSFWPEAFSVVFGLLILLAVWAGSIAWASGAEVRVVAGLPAVALLPTAAAVEAHSRWTGPWSATFMLSGLALLVIYPPVMGILHAWGGA